MYVQIGAGKKKQILHEYPLSQLNYVSYPERAVGLQKAVGAYFDAMQAEYRLIEDPLTGFPRELGDFVERRFRVVDSAQVDLERLWSFNSLSTFDDLAAFLAEPSTERLGNKHNASPVLLVSESFTGKTAVLKKLMHKLPEIGKQAGWVGGLPLVPIRLEPAKLECKRVRTVPRHWQVL